MTRTTWLDAHDAGAGRRHACASQFYADDPLRREPEAADALKVVERDIVLSFDLAENLFATPERSARSRPSTSTPSARCGFQLVHQPDRRAAAVDRGGGMGPVTAQGRRPVR